MYQVMGLKDVSIYCCLCVFRVLLFQFAVALFCLQVCLALIWLPSSTIVFSVGRADVIVISLLLQVCMDYPHVNLCDLTPSCQFFTVTVKVDVAFNYETMDAEASEDRPAKILLSFDVVFFDRQVNMYFCFI